MNMDMIINVSTIVLVVSILILLYRNNKKEAVRKIVLALVVQAEKNLGSGTGELKYADVIKSLYSCLPSVVRILFTEGDIDKYIEEGVQSLKEILSSGVDLKGYEIENVNNTEVSLLDSNNKKQCNT